MPGLFDDDEPSLRKVSRTELIKAYADELKQHPPFAGVAGDGPAFDAKRNDCASKDIARVFRAALKLNCTVQLVPLTTQEKKT